jgi:hypothetical protein
MPIVVSDGVIRSSGDVPFDLARRRRDALRSETVQGNRNMLDIKFIRDNPAIVQHACDVKRIDLSVEQLLDLDRTVVKQKQALQALQQEKNQVAASFPTAKAPEQRELLKSRGR